MEIKSERQLEEGTIIEYRHRVEAMGVAESTENGSKLRFRTENIQVVKCYRNFVMFRQLEPPHLTINLSNNELYQMGVYKEGDFVKEFTR